MDNSRIPQPDNIRSPQDATNGWGWVDHRLQWFLDDMYQEEILLYSYLITRSDKFGCCWDSSRQITRALKMSPKSLIKARKLLEERKIIATKKDDLSQRIIYQVLPLPIDSNKPVQIPLTKQLRKKKELQKEQASSDTADNKSVQHKKNLDELLKIQDIIDKY